jgi:DnaJ-class molecular chaperone
MNICPVKTGDRNSYEIENAFVTCRVRWKHKKENKKKKKDKAQDPYKLLGLEDIRWMATASQIKKAYQKAALKHHPDKACAGVEDAAEKARIEEKFKYILVSIDIKAMQLSGRESLNKIARNEDK